MLQLQYTLNQLNIDTDLRSSVATFMMMGATVQDGVLTCLSGEKPESHLIPYIKEYRCMIKMPADHRDVQVYEGIAQPQEPYYATLVQGGEPELVTPEFVNPTREQRKRENFETPNLIDGFRYVPSDIQEIDGRILQIMINNGCELVTIQEYLALVAQKLPTDFTFDTIA